MKRTTDLIENMNEIMNTTTIVKEEDMLMKTAYHMNLMTMIVDLQEEAIQNLM
eukprot:CAMPEP_0178973912 /NCGR_PEP_ID=MMETSP0789-20121207/22051_1 /TAXON_ID=3005 /ORGANISM="Rhizosolenia setigera, Strain CCMP 1694" /LENGTH=52 /DNA_ID=CAMNT_0020661961 /DNA_START=148 /DNA_END=303 /DNA_ORIENTATION=+